MLQDEGANPVKRACKSVLILHRPARCALVSAGVLVGALIAAPAALAQSAGFDTSLRSIAPATINQANFDVRARSPVQSIGPSSVENRATMVPAVYDPSLGRFVSAATPSRGAISVTSSSSVSVLVGGQSNSFVVGSTAGNSPQRSDALASPSVSVTSLQVTATPGAGGRQ